MAPHVATLLHDLAKNRSKELVAGEQPQPYPARRLIEPEPVTAAVHGVADAVQVVEQAGVEEDALDVELDAGLQEKHPARPRPAHLARLAMREVVLLQVYGRVGPLPFDAGADSAREAHVAGTAKAQHGPCDPVRHGHAVLPARSRR